MIAKDTGQSFRGALAKLVGVVNSPLTTELLAIREALLVVQYWGLLSVQVESDASEAVQIAIGERQADQHQVAIMADIRCAARQMQGVQFLYVNREGNRVAHELAAWAQTSSVVAYWPGRPPDWINLLLGIDFFFDRSFYLD